MSKAFLLAPLGEIPDAVSQEAQLRYQLDCAKRPGYLPEKSLAQRRIEVLRRLALLDRQFVPNYFGAISKTGELLGVIESAESACLYHAKPVLTVLAATEPRHRRHRVASELYAAARSRSSAPHVHTMPERTPEAVALLKHLKFAEHIEWLRAELVMNDEVTHGYRGLRDLPEMFAFREVRDGLRLAGLMLGRDQTHVLRPAVLGDLPVLTQLRYELAHGLRYATTPEHVECGTAELLSSAKPNGSVLYVVADANGRVEGTARLAPRWSADRGMMDFQVRDVVLAGTARGAGLLPWLLKGLVYFGRGLLHGDEFNWFTREYDPVILSTWVPGQHLLSHLLAQVNGFVATGEMFAESN